MTRAKNTEKRRAQIAKALRRVMAQRGYEGASIAAIAEAANLTPGLVHYHFKSKREILLFALRQLRAEHELRLDILWNENRSPRARIVGFIERTLGLGEYADAETLACWIILSGEALKDPDVQVLYEDTLTGLHQRLTIEIESGMAQGMFRCTEPATAASAILCATQGFLLTAGVARPIIPVGSAARSTLLMAQGILHAEPPLQRTKRTG